MANYKLNHSRSMSNMNNEYWTKPSQGFDQAWHNKKQKQEDFYNKLISGKHGTHELDVILTPEGPHAGKIVCKTCNKFVTWVPNYIINT